VKTFVDIAKSVRLSSIRLERSKLSGTPSHTFHMTPVNPPSDLCPRTHTTVNERG